MTRIGLYLVVMVTVGSFTVLGQTAAPSRQVEPAAGANNARMETTEDWNLRLQQLVHSAVSNANGRPSPGDYRIGPNDELAINVLDAPDLCNAYRVAADGDLSIPLLGTIKAAGLTPRELELVLQALLRRTYMKDPQVGVTVIEMQSHNVSVLGAVKTPGVYQIRGTKTLLEVLSLAGGLAADAGNTVVIMRGASAQFARDNDYQIQTVKAAAGQAPGGAYQRISTSGNQPNANTIEVNLKQLLDTGDPRYNVSIYPGDIVKVRTAGIVYVIGDVNRPGGFPVPDNEHITVLQALALGSGLAPDAAKNKSKIIRIAQDGKQIELPVRLGKILSGKLPDFQLRPRDILFIPHNGAKSVSSQIFRTISQVAVWRAIP